MYEEIKETVPCSECGKAPKVYDRSGNTMVKPNCHCFNSYDDLYLSQWLEKTQISIGRLFQSVGLDTKDKIKKIWK